MNDENVIQTGQAQVDYSALLPQTESTDELNTITDTGNEDATTETSEISTVDPEEAELLALLEDDTVEEPESEDSEPKDDDSDFDGKFQAHFEKTFGLKPDEAVALVQELVAEREERKVQGQLNELRAIWGGIDDESLYQRLETVREVYNSLTPENQMKFNSPKGAATIWKRLEMQGKTPKTLQRSKSQSSVKPTFMYTQQQIDAMPASEYRKQADKIAAAYANGLVKK